MKIVCIGRNYVEHAKEIGLGAPTEPLIFQKPSTAIHRPAQDFYVPDFTKDLQHEVEVVLKICKNGKSIDPQFSHKYYEEFTLGIDFTARDVQRELMAKGHPWEKAKAFDHSAVIGEFQKVADYDFNNLNYGLKKNGKLLQNGNTKDMVFNFDYILAEASKYFTLQQGDLLFCGSPAGVSPVKGGDVLEIVLEDKKLYTLNIK